MNSSKNVVRAENDSIDRFLANLNGLRKNEKFCDVTIVIAGSSFPCHRAVLVSASSYFNSMFGGHFQESDQKVITLNEIKEGIFESLLEFMYCRQIAIDRENAFDLLIASKFFDLADLEELCVCFMEENLTRNRILEICKFARLIGQTILYEKAMAYVAENLVDLSKEEAFLEVPYEILEDVISHSNLERVDDIVLDLIVRWNDYNVVREPELRILLNYINTGSITSDYLVRLVPKMDDVERLHVCVYGVFDSKRSFNEFTYKSSNELWNFKCREYTEEKQFERNVIVGDRQFTLSNFSSIEGVNSKKRIRNYSQFKVKELLRDYTMLNQPRLTLSQWHYELINVNSIIYVYCRELKTLPVFTYDSVLDKWFNITNPQIMTINSCTASMNNLLYMVGGTALNWYNKFILKAFVQAYDPRAPKWTLVAGMSQKHINGAACSLEGKMYVLGGETKVFERFDPTAGKWEVLKPSSYNHTFHSLISYSGKLWAISRDLNVPIEIYDPGMSKWTESRGLRSVAAGCACVVDAFVY